MSLAATAMRTNNPKADEQTIVLFTRGGDKLVLANGVLGWNYDRLRELVDSPNENIVVHVHGDMRLLSDLDTSPLSAAGIGQLVLIGQACATTIELGNSGATLIVLTQACLQQFDCVMSAWNSAARSFAGLPADIDLADLSHARLPLSSCYDQVVLSYDATDPAMDTFVAVRLPLSTVNRRRA